jgi:gliding motility-associated-like protein
MRKTFTLLSLLTFFHMASAQDAALSPPNGNITSPVTGCSLTANENVTISIFNFGPGTINVPFNVSYSINAGAPVTETVPAPNIPPNTSFVYTFTTQANLSVPGTYTFDATVSVPGDPTAGNNTYAGYVVTSQAPSAGGTIAGPSSVCETANSGTLTLSGHTGNVLRWEYSTDGGGTWINITNTTTTQNYSNLTVPTMYRAVVQNGGCAAANSAPITIAIDPATVGGTLAPGTTTVCSGTNSGTITLSGHTGSVQNWEFSIDGGVTWTPIANTTTSQAYTNLTTSTRYRAVVRSGACATANSSQSIINVSPVSVGGTVSPASTTVCSGSNSGTLTLSGHTGTVQRWEFSIDGGVTWTNITNTTTSQTYTNLTQTRLYRALVRSGVCTSVYSSIATITVSPGTTAGTIASSATVCSGSNSGTITLTGNTGSVVRWEFSIDGGVTWTNIANTTTSQAYTNLTQTTLYRARVQNGTCAAAYTNIVTITVNAVSVGGTVSGAVTGCSGSNSGTLTLSGQTGAIQRWESSSDGGATWTAITNTTTSQSYSNLTDTTIYWVIVQSGVCPADTSAADTVIIDPVTVGGSISGSTTACSGSNSGTLVLTGNTGNVLNWEFSTDNGLTWISISNTTTSQTYTNLTTPTMYRALVKSGVCSSTYSGTATVGIDPVSVGGTLYGTTTVCSGSNSGTVTLIGHSGTIQGWEASIDNGATWTAIANTSTTENYTNLTDTTIYRVIVISGVCPADTSSLVTIYVDANSVGGTVAGADTVCGGSNSGVLTLSGETGTVVNWEISTDGGVTWLSVSNTTTSQSYSNLTMTTMYRALVKNGVCTPVNSTSATITVDQPSDGGTIMSSAAVCSGTNNGILTLTGYTGSVQGWEMSTDSGMTWTPIVNTTDTLSYTNLTDTTWYRAIVLSGTSCPADTSAMAVITVDPVTVGGTIAGSDTVCASSNSGTLMLGGYTGTIQAWEFSTDGGNTWIATTNTTDSLVYNNLTASMWYRVRVQSGVCSFTYSDTAWILVDPIAMGGTLNGSATVCATANSGLLNLTGYTGMIQGWESSNDGGVTWTAIANTTDTLSYTNLTDTTWYRVIVGGGACPGDTSTVATIIVDPVTVGGTIAGSDTVCAGSNSGTLMLGGYTGMVQGWEFSTDGGNTWIPTTNTTDSLVYNNLSASMWYRVKVMSGVCGSAYSDTAWILVDPVSQGGIISGSTAACEGASGTLTLSGHTGNVVQWESSTDGGLSWTGIGNTTTTLNYSGLTDTTWYRAIVMSGICAADTSSMAVITIYPKPVAGFTAADVCEGSATVFTDISSVSVGSITFHMWTFGDGDVSINTNPVHTYADTGTYVVTLIVTSNFGCTDTAIMNVTVNPLPSAQIMLAGPAQFCMGDSTTLSVTSGANLAYNWSTGDTTASIMVDSSGTYVITVTDTLTGCSSMDSVMITVFPLPVADAGADDTISLGSSIVLNGSGGINYSWTPLVGLSDPYVPNPVASPVVTTNYILTVTDANGCQDMDTVTITVEENFEFMVANMITPNGDGYNDTWYIENIELYTENEVAVYNRNGQEVFSATAYANTWDGTFNGKELPDGTYYYVIRFTDSGKVLKGAITILRKNE